VFRALTPFVAGSLATALLSAPASATITSPVRFQPRPFAGSCSATMTAFSFGVFSPLTQTGRLAQSFVSFNCPYVVAEIDLSSGISGDFGARTMTSGRDRQGSIAYNIYLDAGRTIVFGDGAAGSSAYVPGGGVSRGTFPIYAEIALGQSNVVASDYSDSLSITVRMVQ
jgi:spore coat protein U domain-containing protein, fimbrial subunit CupE1/2/3/6